MIVRLSKILLVSFVGLLGLLTGIDNIVDYQTNFEVVQHVMSMDTTRPGNALMGRAISSDALHRLFYAGIIAVELVYGSLCVFGALRLFGALRASAAEFHALKDVAIGGLTLGFSLYFFGFMIVGGEWFQMWQSAQWNLQQAAFRFIGGIGLILLFVALPEDDRRSAA
jgi:predicted small integral membrane protein